MPGTLSDVQFDIEDIHLQLYEKKPAACGVMLNNVASLGKAKRDKLVLIQSEELVHAVHSQDLQGKSCYGPTIVPPEVIKKSLAGKVPLKIRVK